jgi:hypothetical protein
MATSLSPPCPPPPVSPPPPQPLPPPPLLSLDAPSASPVCVQAHAPFDRSSGQKARSATLGRHRASRANPVANSARVHPNDESIEEIFGQLWVIPNMERARVPEQRSQGGGLVWVCSELVRAGKVTPVDCFLVSQRVEGIPKLISFAPGSWRVSPYLC